MKNSNLISLLLLLLVVPGVCGKTTPYSISHDSIYKHISILAADSLEGREVGEIGEWKAAIYIQKIFKTYGLESKGLNDSYLQDFEFVKRIDFGENNHLLVNGEQFELHDEFIPMKQSKSTRFEYNDIVDVNYGIKINEDDGDYNDYKDKDVEGKAVLIKRFAPSKEDFPHIDFDKYSSLTDKIKTALDNKAAGIFFYTPEDQDDTLNTIVPSYLYPKDIPIIFLRRKGFERLGLDLSHPEINKIYGETELIKTRDTGYNVIGYLPTNYDTTVIIGAHYDHLGWGTSTSLYRGKEKMVHNGADDNASGVAALLELARYYSSIRNQLKYSILFITFTGEEAGLLGSSKFAKNMTIDSSKVRMMINMDMIGRLKDQEKGLAILGTGTCFEFKDYFDSLAYDDIKLVFKESGSGPSDHTAFYNRKIPVLSFFTGAHKDYHKPSDDVEKIDIDGIVKVTDIVKDVITFFDKYDGPLTFQKTKDSGEGKRRSQFSVTLGIMPDYIAEIKGLKVDGVSPERPGERAGILEGDIIIKMGDITIDDIYDYMNALGKFRKGDSIIVIVERGSDTLNLQVIFE